ncbi:MAG TPA: prolipoprotein diacylglyceryl transferase [Tepidisphaeraceae bacterium]|jgi:phosphatidylglycerol:prolipoprotein diacylglycerol transferase|nr:prolipoprotein diacylglyceryl transferase [Tepidisphaeraceae bacterium]
MLQEIFRIPWLGIPIYGYGLMLVIGFLLATELAKFLARHARLNQELFVNAGLIALVTGVIGARISHVIENWPDYSRADLSFWQNAWNAINIRSGGLTFYGGLILGFFCALAYGLWKKAPIRVGMDVLAPALMVGLGLGRVGCFLNGCCYGAECNTPWAVSFPYYSNAYQDEVDHGEVKPPEQLELMTDAGNARLMTPEQAQRAGLWQVAKQQHSKRLHPAQLYSTIDALLVAAVCVAYFTIPHAPGRGFALMMLMMGPIRFLTEMIRAEPPVTWIGNYGWSFSMVLSVFFVVGGLILWVVCGKIGTKDEWMKQVGTLTPA